LTSYLPIVDVGDYCCVLSHARTHTHTVCRTPMHEGSIRRSGLLPAQHTTKRQTYMSTEGFESAISVTERPQT